MAGRTKLLALVVLVTACSDSEDRYKTGFNDGYAAGYNTECKIRVTLIEGDWDDKDYSRGYKQGNAKGIEDCWNRDNEY